MTPELLKAHLKALLPPGSGWQLEEGGELDLIIEGLAENFSDVKEFLDALAHVRDPFKTPVLSDLEWDLGFLTDPDLDEETRRKQLAAFQYDDTESVGSADDLQELLINAGFDVLVHVNNPAVDPSLFGGELLVNGLIQTFTPAYLAQCGGVSTVCGNSDAVCGRFDSQYRIDFEYPFPTDPEEWPFVFFVGGPATRDIGTDALTSIAPADVPLQRKEKFINFILKTKPLPTWAVLIINYI